MRKSLSKFVKEVKKPNVQQHYPAYHQPAVPPRPANMATVPTDYPRPDFVRSALHWESLNGPWDFLFDDLDEGQAKAFHLQGLPSHAAAEGKPNAKRTIQVPFVFQAPASGIHEKGVHQVLWYERRIEDLRSAEEKANGFRLLLRFGAVDYHAKVWLDGRYTGEHSGGHVPFDVDLTDALATSTMNASRLTIRVFDSAYGMFCRRSFSVHAHEMARARRSDTCPTKSAVLSFHRSYTAAREAVLGPRAREHFLHAVQRYLAIRVARECASSASCGRQLRHHFKLHEHRTGRIRRTHMHVWKKTGSASDH